MHVPMWQLPRTAFKDGGEPSSTGVPGVGDSVRILDDSILRKSIDFYRYIELSWVISPTQRAAAG